MSLEAISVSGSLCLRPLSSLVVVQLLDSVGLKERVFPLISASYLAPVYCHGSSAQPMSGGECQFNALASSDSQGLCGSLSLPLYPESADCPSKDMPASCLFVGDHRCFTKIFGFSVNS